TLLRPATRLYDKIRGNTANYPNSYHIKTSLTCILYLLYQVLRKNIRPVPRKIEYDDLVRCIVNSRDGPKMSLRGVVLAHDTPETDLQSVAPTHDTTETNLRTVESTHDAPQPQTQIKKTCIRRSSSLFLFQTIFNHIFF